MKQERVWLDGLPWAMDYCAVVEYDPDELWPARWKATLHEGDYLPQHIGPYVHTIHAMTRNRAIAKAGRYVRHRVKRIKRHSK